MGPIGTPELIIILGMGVGLLVVAFWIWMLIDCIKYETDEGNERLIWVVVIALTGALGAFIYLCARRIPRQSQVGR